MAWFSWRIPKAFKRNEIEAAAATGGIDFVEPETGENGHDFCLLEGFHKKGTNNKWRNNSK